LSFWEVKDLFQQETMDNQIQFSGKREVKKMHFWSSEPG
jgi:hypothetical protein